VTKWNHVYFIANSGYRDPTWPEDEIKKYLPQAK